MEITIEAYLMLALTVALTSTSQVLQKQVALHSMEPDTTIKSAASPLWLRYAKQPRLWTALALLVLGMATWLKVLQIMPVGKAYPLLSANYIVVLMASKYVFSEPIPLVRWLGVIVICFALFLIGGHP